MAKNKKNKSRNRNRQNNRGKANQTSQPKNQNNASVKVLSNNFKIFIIMESDWHIGSGGGIPGNIDRLVQRDKDGLPGIQAKTLTGVWRDACESVALGLDSGKQGVWSKYVEYLFGDQPALNQDSTALNPPIRAALNIRPATLHHDLRETILNRSDTVKKALIKAMTFSKSGISIDPVNGCAREKFLRQEEMVRAGTYLESQCQLNLEELPEEQKKAACALLIAGAVYLDKLGGKRRRGAGKCRLEFKDIKNAKTWIDWIGENRNPPEPFPEVSLSSVTTKEPERVLINNSNYLKKQQFTWFEITLTITAKLPIIIKARTVGNVVETLNYIQGNKLLPIVARKISRLGINLADAITNHQLIITNAAFAIANKSGRPVPLALFYEKMYGGFDKGRVYNQLIETPSEDKQLKGYRQGYVGRISKLNEVRHLPDYAVVNTVIQTHNTIDDSSQRPTEDIGGIYSYQAIEAGTTLQAQLRLTTDLITVLEQKDRQWWKKLAGYENIGTSKKDDYGLVEIKVTEPKKIAQKRDIITINKLKEHQLIVWLLSDVLIRNRQLRPSISIDDFQETLEKALNDGLPEDKQIALIAKQNESENENTLAYMRQRRTESWQKRWGLPRPSLAGFMAGSCIELTVKSNLEISHLNEKIKYLSIVGIGERTIEGYGQISFNDPLLNQKIYEMPSKIAIQNSTNNDTNVENISARKSFTYARLIEKQAWRNAISNSAKALASNPKKREQLLGIKIITTNDNKESCPSMNQLGNLRAFIAQLREGNDAPIITNWIEHTREKRPQKWQKTNNGLDRIKDLINSDRKNLDELKDYTTIPLEDLTITKNANSNLTIELRTEAIRTVVYECIRAHKRDFEA